MRRKRITIDGEPLIATSEGRIFYANPQNHKKDELTQSHVKNSHTGYQNPYLYVHVFNTAEKTCHIHLVSRIVCQAFHPTKKDINTMQVDHINDDPTDNRPENLQWVTRSQNNGKRDARLRRSINHKHVIHPDEIIKGWDSTTLQTRYFLNGIHASKAIGCSHVLVYKALRGHEVEHARGWHLEWTKRESLDPEIVRLAQADWDTMRGKIDPETKKKIVAESKIKFRQLKKEQWSEIATMRHLSPKRRTAMKKKATRDLETQRLQWVEEELAKITEG